MRHDSRHLHPCSVGHCFQFRRRHHSTFLQVCPQRGHRVLPWGHARCHQISGCQLKLRHAGQRRCVGKREPRQHALTFRCRHARRPQCLTTVNPQRPKCPCARQCFHVPNTQPSSAGDICCVDKWPRCDNALRHVIAHTGDGTEPQTNTTIDDAGFHA